MSPENKNYKFSPEGAQSPCPDAVTQCSPQHFPKFTCTPNQQFQNCECNTEPQWRFI